jgi:hypothetical protein
VNRDESQKRYAGKGLGIPFFSQIRTHGAELNGKRIEKG